MTPVGKAAGAAVKEVAGTAVGVSAVFVVVGPGVGWAVVGGSVVVLDSVAVVNLVVVLSVVDRPVAVTWTDVDGVEIACLVGVVPGADVG